jgi:hypothetical protein
LLINLSIISIINQIINHQSTLKIIKIYYFCGIAVLYCRPTKWKFCFNVSNYLGLFLGRNRWQYRKNNKFWNLPFRQVSKIKKIIDRLWNHWSKSSLKINDHYNYQNYETLISIPEVIIFLFNLLIIYYQIINLQPSCIINLHKTSSIYNPFLSLQSSLFINKS